MENCGLAYEEMLRVCFVDSDEIGNDLPWYSITKEEYNKVKIKINKVQMYLIFFK